MAITAMIAFFPLAAHRLKDNISLAIGQQISDFLLLIFQPLISHCTEIIFVGISLSLLHMFTVMMTCGVNQEVHGFKQIFCKFFQWLFRVTLFLVVLVVVFGYDEVQEAGGLQDVDKDGDIDLYDLLSLWDKYDTDHHKIQSITIHQNVHLNVLEGQGDWKALLDFSAPRSAYLLSLSQNTSMYQQFFFSCGVLLLPPQLYTYHTTLAEIERLSTSGGGGDLDIIQNRFIVGLALILIYTNILNIIMYPFNAYALTPLEKGGRKKVHFCRTLVYSRMLSLLFEFGKRYIVQYFLISYGWPAALPFVISCLFGTPQTVATAGKRCSVLCYFLFQQVFGTYCSTYSQQQGKNDDADKKKKQ
jgi:hypothetical protein